MEGTFQKREGTGYLLEKERNVLHAGKERERESELFNYYSIPITFCKAFALLVL